MTANVVRFRSRAEIASAEVARLAHGRIIVCKVIMPDTNWKRRRWVVIEVFLDGSYKWRDGMKDERTALFVADILAKKYGFSIVNLGVR